MEQVFLVAFYSQCIIWLTVNSLIKEWLVIHAGKPIHCAFILLIFFIQGTTKDLPFNVRPIIDPVYSDFFLTLVRISLRCCFCTGRVRLNLFQSRRHPWPEAHVWSKFI